MFLKIVIKDKIFWSCDRDVYLGNNTETETVY